MLGVDCYALTRTKCMNGAYEWRTVAQVGRRHGFGNNEHSLAEWGC